MDGRSFAGFQYRQRLGTGFFGEEHRAVGPGGAPARVLHVVPGLAEAEGYSEALARFGSDLGELEGDAIVATHTVGRALDGTLVVITGDPGRAPSVEEVVASVRGQAIPQSVALQLARGLARGLAGAHRQGIVHGGVHPRSVKVDEHGRVVLDHFAVARALASVAARSDDPDLLSGFRGYLAPELALGEEPTPASDVYAAGVFMFELFGGDTSGGVQPRRLRATTSIRRLVLRAMDTDASRRFPSAVELLAELERSIETDRCELASPGDMALYSDDARDRMLSSAEDTSEPALDEVLAGLDDDDDDLALAVDDGVEGLDEDEGPTEISPGRRPSSDDAVDDVLASLEEPSQVREPTATGSITPPPDTRVEADPILEDTGDHSQLTQVDEPQFDVDRDPISELIELDKKVETPSRRLRLDSGEDDHTPLPPPAVHESGSFTREGRDVLAGRKGSRSVQQRAEDAISALEDDGAAEAPPPGRVQTDYVGRRKIPGWVWGAGTILGLVVMFLLVWTRTDVFHPERAERKRKAREAERRAEEAKLEAEQTKGGDIVVQANEEGAAVWLRLGRTPLDTMPLPAYHPHQIRFELEGYEHDDVVVTARHWTGDRATVTRELERAPEDHEIPPWPPPMPDEASEGFELEGEVGLGVVHIESEPPQAEVWLLVGYTNSVHMRDFEAGVRYELKLTKEGFRTAFAVIEEEDWKLGGADPDLLRDTVIEQVKLEPIEGG